MQKIQIRLPKGQYLEKLWIELDITSDSFIVQAPYNPTLIDELRSMKGAKWHPEEKIWKIPINERNIYAFKYLQGYKSTRYQNEVKILDDLPYREEIFEHQKLGITFLLQRKCCMLGFEMGLGKSLTVLEFLRFKNLSDWWLIAPYGAQREWLRQLKRWTTEQYNYPYPKEISTYESLHKLIESKDKPPQVIIFDESIKIKNPNAKRSQIAYQLCELMRKEYGDEAYIILLSGFPGKDPGDWWHQIECMFPGWLREGDLFKFRRRYANLELIDEGYGKFFKINSWKEDELKKLGKRLSPIVLVKKKKDCFDLPEKIFETIECEPNKELERVAELLLSQCTSSIEALECLRELSDGFRYIPKGDIVDSTSGPIGQKYNWIGSSKLSVISELLDFYHTENGGVGKLVIYAVFHAAIDELYKWVSGNDWHVGKIDGRGWSNQNILDDFDNLDNYCIIAHPGSVYGLSFAKTECLIYYSNSFTLDHRVQSLDRRDRPGMDKSKGTRIVDIINLPTDRLILDKLNQGINLQTITLEEIRQCFHLSS